MQPVAFNEATYNVEPNVSYKDEKGILKTRQCNLTNFIRWRYAKEGSEAATKAKEDNIESHRLETQVGLTQVANAPKVSLVYITKHPDFIRQHLYIYDCFNNVTG